MKWMIAANATMYDHAAAFQRWGFIDWRQRAKYSVGDIVYIYCTRPYMKVMYKAVVERESIPSSEIVDDREYWHKEDEYLKALVGMYARLKLVNQADNENLSLSKLMQHGLKAAPQGPVKINEELSSYIDRYMNDFANTDVFPDSDIPEKYYEGGVCSVQVNKYERSSIARQRCIEYNGSTCFVCGFNFKEFYGEPGDGFIHIHHIVPLNEIGKEYVVDYKKDLIPVCPNCHAMLHRKIDGKYIDWQALKIIVNKGE